jgi:pimeloyl-ACP methyl ester carboxylesterase
MLLTMAPAPTFVLVHSPLVGPTTWAPVAAVLRRRGHEVVVPSLLGLAFAPQPQWRHAVETVHEATAGLAGPVVLAGHSGAGALLPAIAGASPVEVAALVFVDAFLPPASGAAAPTRAAALEHLRPLAEDGVLPPWPAWFGEDTMRELVPDATLRADLEREMPRLPLSYLDTSIPVPDGWARTPSAYVLLSEDPYGPSAADAEARGWPVAVVPGAHHLSIAADPGAVSDALLAVAP